MDRNGRDDQRICLVEQEIRLGDYAMTAMEENVSKYRKEGQWKEGAVMYTLKAGKLNNSSLVIPSQSVTSTLLSCI